MCACAYVRVCVCGVGGVGVSCSHFLVLASFSKVAICKEKLNTKFTIIFYLFIYLFILDSVTTTKGF